MSLPLSTTYSHLHDSAVQFDASKHVYTVNGCSDYTSVTTWVGSLFPSFDPELVITKMMAFHDSIENTNAVLDGVLESTVYSVINSGLQEIGLGIKTPEQVASATQEAMDAQISTN